MGRCPHSTDVPKGRAIVVEHRRRGARLGPRLDIVRDVLRREGPRPRVVERAAKRRPAARPEEALGYPRQLEEEHVPGSGELARAPQGAHHPAGMGAVEDRQPLHDLRVVRRRRPGGPGSPVVSDQEGPFRSPFADQVADVGRQQVGAVCGHVRRARREVVAARVGRNDAKAGLRKRRDLPAPTEPELREAVQQDDERTVSRLDVVDSYVLELGVSVLQADGLEGRHGCVASLAARRLRGRPLSTGRA